MTDQNSSLNSASPATPTARPRRRGLIIGGIAALAIVAGGVGVAVSQPGEWGGRGHGGGYGQVEGQGRGGMIGRMGGGGKDRMNPEKMGARIDWGVDRMLTDASPEQKQKVATIMKDAFKDLAPVREQMKSARADVVRVLKADKVDRAEIERLRAQRMGEMEAASKRMAQAIGDLGETLTAKQRVEVVSRMEGFAFGRGHRH
jgi:Spy/CpxP family protein refolding chaperone